MPFFIDDDDFAGLQLADEFSLDQVEGAGFRGQHIVSV